MSQVWFFLMCPIIHDSSYPSRHLNFIMRKWLSTGTGRRIIFHHVLCIFLLYLDVGECIRGNASSQEFPWGRHCSTPVAPDSSLQPSSNHKWRETDHLSNPRQTRIQHRCAPTPFTPGITWYYVFCIWIGYPVKRKRKQFLPLLRLDLCPQWETQAPDSLKKTTAFLGLLS